MKFLENLVSSLAFHQPKFRCWIIGTARIRLAVSFGSGVLAFIAGKAAKEGICFEVMVPIFFVLPRSCLPSLPLFFSDLIFLGAWLFVFISKKLAILTDLCL